MIIDKTKLSSYRFVTSPQPPTYPQTSRLQLLQDKDKGHKRGTQGTGKDVYDAPQEWQAADQAGHPEHGCGGHHDPGAASQRWVGGRVKVGWRSSEGRVIVRHFGKHFWWMMIFFLFFYCDKYMCNIFFIFNYNIFVYVYVYIQVERD